MYGHRIIPIGNNVLEMQSEFHLKLIKALVREEIQVLLSFFLQYLAYIPLYLPVYMG